MSAIQIKYISSGKFETGGYSHELFFSIALRNALLQVEETKLKVCRKCCYYKGLANLMLILRGYVETSAEVNIVTARFALSALIRNIFKKRKILIVLHNYDPKFNKSWYLKLYYSILFFALKSLHLSNAAIITCAPFWVDLFKTKLNQKIKIFHFPNLFQVDLYKKYKTNEKLKQIHLGQYSAKNDPLIFKLAENLTKSGFDCYFSTLNKSETTIQNNYSIICEPYEFYLKRMARSQYTLAFIGIQEGWNRVAHESILVNTCVIGVDSGGLGNLLKESGSYVAENIEEIIQIIERQKSYITDEEFVKKYDSGTAAEWIKPVVKFCLS